MAMQQGKSATRLRNKRMVGAQRAATSSAWGAGEDSKREGINELGSEG